MNPIPLAAPDGRVYAYACGTCHLVAGGSTPMWIEDPPGPASRIVEGIRQRAERCCTCFRCATPMNRLDGLYCADCCWLIAMGQLWTTIGSTHSLQPCQICGARYTSIACHTTPACSACEMEHASYDGKCRDCNLSGERA